jgi:ribonuclease R
MKKKLLQGLIKRHPDGFGFFIPEDTEHPDVYIPRNSMTGVMTGDRVMIEVFPERGGDRFRGEVVKIVSRGSRQIVGIFTKLNDEYGIIKDEAHAWGQDLRIDIDDSKNAESGQMVAVEILNFPDEGELFQGRVKEILGSITDPLSDIKRVIFSNSIPHEWPKAVEQEAKYFKHDPNENDFEGRRDIRDLNLITIDGATAKDFDDAVYVENNNDGFRLVVAIADVSHYVRPDTAIDKEAYERGTSVYFPNFVVPMLPEVLSNGLCSLNPHVPRLCLVADMQFDFTGEMKDSEFYEAVMESKARVTYGQAQEIIDGHDIDKLMHVKKEILRCADLAKILMARRFKEGSLDLEIPETELQIDSAGVPVDVIRSERLFSHRLIEEMMLAANVAVAKFLASKDIPAIYRIHEPPPEQSIQVLEKFLWNFGGHVRLEGGKLQKRLTKALKEFEGKPEAQVLNILTLRSMSQAKYSTNNVGHFGLGFDYYTHFTSPIRRYPDLIVHRLIKSQILRNSKYRLVDEDSLSSAATFLSACEQRSTKAERQLQGIKKARFMEKLIGQEFDGIISSIAKFGIFVLLREYDIDGLLRLDSLGGKYEFDEDNLRLVAKRSGFSYNMGDIVKIRVAEADINLGQVNFVLADQKAKETADKEERIFSRKNKKEKFGDKYSDKPVWARNKSRGGKGKDRDHDRDSNKDDRGRKSKNKRQDERRKEISKEAGKKGKKGGKPSFRNLESERDRRIPEYGGRRSYDSKPPEETPKPQGRKRSMFEELMSKDFDEPSRNTRGDSSGRGVLKGIKASYRSRETFGGSDSESDRKNSEKRRPSSDDRGGLRKTRFSQRSRKG